MQHKKTSGFTLIETLVAITLLSIAITGPFITAEKSIEAANIAKHKMTASFLAQEGIELVRTMRDNAYITGCFYDGGYTACKNWWGGFTSNDYDGGKYNILQCETPGSSCAVDASAVSVGGVGFGTGSITACVSSSCGELYLTSDGRYTTDSTGNTKTSFKRVVSVTNISNTEISVTSKVEWSTHGKSYSVSAIDHLTSWY